MVFKSSRAFRLPPHFSQESSYLVISSENLVSTMSNTQISVGEPWSTTAPTYATNIQKTSGLSASHLVGLAHAVEPISEDTSYVLDNGAGTGAVTLSIAARLPGTRTLATDTSASMLSNIDAQYLPNVSTQVVDARELTQKLDKGTFTHVFSTFMLQTITTPLAAVQEMYDVLQPGGVIGIGLWARRNGPFEIWERACQLLDPRYKNTATPFDDPHAWRTTEELNAALERVGFKDVQSQELKMPFPFESTEAFMKFWFEAKNPAALNLMKGWDKPIEETRRAVEKVVSEEYDGGKEVYTWAVLGVGRK